MADLSHARLEATALQASAHPDSTAQYIPALLVDAWGFVDAVRRLRRFVQLLEGWKKHPELAGFHAHTQAVQDLRDTIQHLEKRVPPRLAESHPLLGELSWIYTPDADRRDRTVVLVVPGSLRTGASTGWKVAQLAATAVPPIDHIILAAWEPSHGQADKTTGASDAGSKSRVIPVSLTQTKARVAALVRTLETVLRPQFEGHEVGAAELVLHLGLEVSGDPPSEPGDPS